MTQMTHHAHLEPDIKAETERQKTALLFRNAGVAQWVNVINASLLAYVNTTLHVSIGLAFVWWCLIVAIAAGRYQLARRFEAAAPDAVESGEWRRRYITATALAGAAWGTGTILFMWDAPNTGFLFTGLVLSGMAAGAIPILASVPAAYRVFALPVLIPMSAIILLQANSALDWAFGFMTILFSGVVLMGARNLHETLDVAIRLSLETRLLAEKIEQARDSAEAALAERKNIEAMLRLDREQQAVLREMLENVVKGGPMKETLELCLSRLLEISWLSLLPMGGIFLMEEDAKTLRLYASRALSQEILTLCNRVPLGRCLCGAAAASREIQFSDCLDGRHEISYPGMTEHGHYNLPLFSEGEVIGVMVLYLPHGFERDQAKEQFLNSVAGILASFIRRKKAEEELRIAASAFESQEAMIVTDADAVILRVNRAFTEITGYTAGEAVGQTPRLLKSGRHGADFYRQMWESINRTGVWQGEIWDRHKNGSEYPKWLTISAVKNDEGTVTHYIGSHYDITEQKLAEEKINELAFFDQLTGLPNRMLLMDRLTQAMSTGSRTGRFGALLFIDLDNFKMLNDTQGHDVGDKFLKQVALRVRSCIRENDTVARLGGDEFVVVVSELSSNQKEAATDIEIVAEKILASFNLPYRLDYTDHHSTASIGVTLFKGHLATHDDLLKQADLAMYKAKAAGRNTIRFFDPAMEAAMIKQAALEGYLRLAIAENQFLLHYQAQVESNGQMTGAEALIRWQHPERGLVPPDEFIPLAEDAGLILPIGLWVLDTACAQIKSWENDAHSRELQIAVNVSARQFRQPDFVAQVAGVLETSGINPARLKLELTESLVLENVEDAIEKMHAIKRLGVRFSMDDFGTGYSSLSYLARLPLDQLKIDRSFVRNLPGKKNDETIARTIITMGRGLNMNVIAEGVETESQRAFLEAHGCDAYQGYLFSRPLPQKEFEEFARNTWRPRQESNL